MRTARALCPTRLAGLMLLALSTATTGHYQGTLICRQPNTHVCLTWLVHSDEFQNFNDAESFPSLRTRQYCGFSKTQALSPHHKFYEVSQVNKNKQPETLHCQRIILIGHFVNWIQINNALSSAIRVRRQTFTPKGRYRGQTQSQYLAIDRGNGKDEGKAEAHSAADSSRASVSGNSGMGQAQSQTIYDPNCEDCYRKPQAEIENLKHPGSLRPGNGYGQNTGSSWPGVHHGQSNYFPNHGGYNPIDTQGFTPGKDPSTTSGSQSPDFYGSKPKTDGYGGTGPNGNIDYRLSGTYGKPTSNNGNMFPNNRPIDPSTNGYEPNNIGGYDTKSVPGNNYKNPGNVGGGIYGPTGSGTNSYLPSNNGVYGPVRNVAPNTNALGNVYTSGYPNQGVGFTPGDSTSGGIYRPTGPGQGAGQIIGPGQGAGQVVRPGHGSSQGIGPGQVIGPDQGPGQRIEPIQGMGHGIQAGQGPGQGQGFGQGLRPDQGLGQGTGSGPGMGQGQGPRDLGQGLGPGQGQGVGTVPGLGGGQGVIPGQGLLPGQGQGVGAGHGGGQGLIPGQGLGPGQGQGVGTVHGQGGGQGVRPGSGQGLGLQHGISQVIPGQNNVGDSQNRIPSTVGEYGPDQGGLGTQYGPYQTGLGSRYDPNQSNLGTEYRPVQSGLGSSPFNTGTNWPMASGPYAGPNSGTTGNVYPNNYGAPNAIHGQSNVPSGLLGNDVNGPHGGANQYGTSNDPGIPQLPKNQYSTNSGRPIPPGGHFGSGISNVPTTSFQYRPHGSGTNTLTQPNPYGTQFDTTNPSKPGSQVIGSQYDPRLGTGVQPSNYGTGIDSTRPFQPGGTGVSDGRTVGNTYEPAIRPNNLPNGQIGIGSGPYMPGGQYSTNVGNVPQQQYGTFTPNNQVGGRGNGNGIYNGQPLPGSQYNNVIHSDNTPGQYGSGNIPGNNLPGNQYNTGTDGTSKGPYSQSNTPHGQYGTGTISSQNVPDRQVGPGTYIGQHGTGTHLGPVANNGLTSPREQFGTGSDILGTYPGGRPMLTGADQNGLVGTDTANYPGSSYNTGSSDGPRTSYGSGTTGPNSPTGYTGGPNIQGQPYGSDRVNVPSYGNGNLNYNSITPGGPYQGGNVGAEKGGVTNGQGGGIPNNIGAPIDGTSGSHGPYNSGGTGAQNNEYGGPQNYVDPNSIDGDDSEAEASVAQGINGTVASASSKGGNDKGRAQTNVHGTYTGTGSFQAQAQITGDNKQAQSEVSGGKKGASSTASGSGRNNKSQANVQLGSETGSVQTQSQSSGVMHSSNSQVQGSVKGGMADAQAKGPGSTSSQAQIGFTPYKDIDKSSHDLQKTPFIGGGVASSQSSGRTGQSQSQLHGTFKYGITYNGAAQSGASIDKDAVFNNRLSFKKIDVFDENEKNINVDITETPQSLVTESEPEAEPSSTSEPYNYANETEVATTKNVIDETMIESEDAHTHLDHHKTDGSSLSGPTLSGSKKSFSTNHINNPSTDYEFSTVKDELPPESDYDTDEPYNPEGSEESDLAQGEYSNYDEFTRENPTHQSLLSPNRKPLEVRQSIGGNTQHIVLGSLKNHNAEIIQKNSDRPDENKVYLAGERIPGTGGYTVPAGFTGSVKSVASKDNTYVVGYRDSPSQAQTVTLTPGTGKVKYMYPPAYGKHVMPKNLRSLYSPRDDNKYLSVSKSVTRALDNENNIRKQYSHTYYTKSSSCGYFTFTCTMVSSAEGRKKVCKPKIPTNPDGTQIRC